MDRYDASDRVSVEQLISSAQRDGTVELTLGGKVMARVVPTPEPAQAPDKPNSGWLAELRSVRASLPPEVLKHDWQATLRAVREGRDL